MNKPLLEEVRPARARNTILEALEVFRRRRAPRPMQSFLLFLYVCENEGLTVTELADLASSTVASTARLVKALNGELPSEGLSRSQALFEYRGTPKDRRVRFVYLTEAGRSLRRSLDELIQRRVTIQSERAA